MGTSGSILGRRRLQTLCAGVHATVFIREVGRVYLPWFSDRVEIAPLLPVPHSHCLAQHVLTSACHSVALVWRALAKLVVKLVSFS